MAKSHLSENAPPMIYSVRFVIIIAPTYCDVKSFLEKLFRYHEYQLPVCDRNFARPADEAVGNAEGKLR